MRVLVLVMIGGACSARSVEPQRTADPLPIADPQPPRIAEPPAPRPAALCVTKGQASVTRDRLTIAESMRGFVPGAEGDAASLDFVYAGPTDERSALASGDVRSQLGLKLRAADSCNVVYVMWRIAPKPELVVQVKRNPGQTTHAECGAEGYTRIKPTRRAPVRAPAVGSTHTLAAAIVGDRLTAWVDRAIAWEGVLPPSARELAGPAGLRADNVRADVAVLATIGSNTQPCTSREAED
jgi:hypothetical protein